MRMIKSLTFLFFVSLISPSFAETFYLDCVANNLERVTKYSKTEKDIYKNKNFRKKFEAALNEINQSGSVTYDDGTRQFENASFLADKIRIWSEITARSLGKIYTQYTFDRNNGTFNFYQYQNDFKSSEIEETRISGSCKKSKKKNMF